MKRSDKMLRKVFEAERNTRAAELEETISRRSNTSKKTQQPPNIMKENLSIDISLSDGPTEECLPVSLSIANDASLQTLDSIDSEAVATPEAPLYSPITPIDRNIFLSGGNTTIEAVVTPEAPLYSPITPIDRNIFPSGGNTIIPESPENSSPVRNMSPDTLKLFETLNHSDFSDDDSVKDPDFIADEDLHNNSSDESTSLTNIVALVHVENSLNSEYCHTSDTTQQPEIIHDNAVSTAIIGDDDIQESQKVDESNSRSHFQVVVSKQLKRRYSENDLQQFHQTHQPLKKLRSASISIACEGRVQKKPKYNTPKKKHISDPSKWKRHIEREKRFKGEAYKTIKEARKKIYESFRTLRTLEAQRQFVIQHVKKEKKKRSTTNGPSRKDFTHHYSFTIGHEKVSVCRDFFLDTLNIKERIIRGALKKVSSEGVLLADSRGKKPPSNKLSNNRFNQIKEHIFSFPAMESHYCRKNTEYKYLDSGLNLKIMYLLYKEKCEEEGTKPAGIETYRKVFRSYKLIFHVPKKDLCKKCVAHKELKSNDMINSEDDSHSKHLKRRHDAYLRRDADKAAAKNDTKTLAFNFDLEAVLQTPKGASGPFFYVRKLAVYNLTFYKFGDQDVDCFTWDKTEGKRGSIEIATCVYKYISTKQDISHVRMMSDNCGGQQKNFNFSCMLLYLVTNHPTILTIDHVFYESGHSHMECDSIHSRIEQKCKNSAVYTPDGWIQVMRLARTNPRPFNVNVLVHEEFLDFNPNQCQFAEEVTRKPNQRKKCSNKEKRNN
ncbi:hypothetical protein HF086_009792 [Spodoptera exigua]|uniref:DUF7869 domain-containing protein n=1 Tax=Spodoptera exigua TaxID=7107 RepID=A0A922SSC5_SPOEX|nr:hypothetical protein HF086_009792 [Spodoptera exigua]